MNRRRGVKLTSPSLSTHSSAYEKALFEYQYPTTSLYPSPSSSLNISDPVIFDEQLRHLKALGAKTDLVVNLLRERNTEEELRSLSTAFVARDL